MPLVTAIKIAPRPTAKVRLPHAAELAVSIDPPTACSTRQPINHSAPWAPFNGSKDSSTEATVNTTKPAL